MAMDLRATAAGLASLLEEGGGGGLVVCTAVARVLGAMSGPDHFVEKAKWSPITHENTATTLPAAVRIYGTRRFA